MSKLVAKTWQLKHIQFTLQKNMHVHIASIKRPFTRWKKYSKHSG